MSWFQLDPQSIAERVNAQGSKVEDLSLNASLKHGIFGFTLVSLIGYAPWMLAGEWLNRVIGESGLSAICALAFIASSGSVLHRLIIGPGSLSRFYKLFSLAFTAYALLWIIGYMTLRGHLGGLIGLLAGTIAMGWLFTRAFDATESTVRVILALFVCNAIGYFVGGWLEGKVVGLKDPCLFGMVLSKPVRTTLAMLTSGICFGIGLGAGLGLAFYYCQTAVRTLLAHPREQSEISKTTV